MRGIGSFMLLVWHLSTAWTDSIAYGVYELNTSDMPRNGLLQNLSFHYPRRCQLFATLLTRCSGLRTLASPSPSPKTKPSLLRRLLCFRLPFAISLGRSIHSRDFLLVTGVLYVVPC